MPFESSLQVVPNNKDLMLGSYLRYKPLSQAKKQQLGVILSEEDKEPLESQSGVNKAEIIVEEWKNPAVEHLPQYKCPVSEQCIFFASELLGRKLHGHAYQIQPNTDNPKVGDAILLYSGSPYGHIGIIQNITSTSYNIIEKNFEGCGAVSTRSIPFNDWKIRGFVH